MAADPKASGESLKRLIDSIPTTVSKAIVLQRQDVEDVLGILAPQLPIQNPIPFFVHNNPLMFYERYPFQEGICLAESTYTNVLEVKSRMLWRDLEDFVIPLVMSYFDQGLNRWVLPAHKQGLWSWYCHYIAASLSMKSAAMPGLRHQLNTFQSQASIDVIVERLGTRISGKQDLLLYLQTLLFHFKGWSGMIQVLEKNPGVFPLQSYKTQFIDWVAILVTAECALAEQKKIADLPIWNKDQVSRHRKSAERCLAGIQDTEFKFYDKVIKQLRNQLDAHQALAWPSNSSGSSVSSAKLVEPDVQAFFCIDDREESLRRSLEHIEPAYETFGTVGFFGVDFSLRRAGHVIFQPHCPPVIQPRKKAEEIYPQEEDSFLDWFRKFLPQLNESRFTPLDPFFALLLWPFYLIALLIRTFMPGTYSQFRDWLRLDHPLRNHHPIRFINEYTIQEKADLVADILGGLGLQRVQAKLVMVVGHAATTTNNPYQKSYGCGACSGQSGFVNAKLFAEFANDPRVRDELKSRHLIIEEHSCFVACCHDTCSDKVYYANEGKAVPFQYIEIFKKFKDDMKKALVLNSDERWQQFHLRGTPRAEARSLDWSQPRPEFGHTGVSLAIFGPRWLTRGFNLHRRSFLVSYDPAIDPDGKHLHYDIMSALPVCANINLDYYTSAAFPEAFGSGSKLPLNIASGIGVMTGSKGDLRIGLARQMIDQHQPVRLLAIIYCDGRKLSQVVAQSPRLINIFKNNWIHVMRIDPVTHEFEFVTDELRRQYASI